MPPLSPPIAAILDALGLDPAHPEACEAEAKAHVAKPGLDDPSLVDRRALPFVTIDELESLDLDQALFVEESGEGHTIWYALADASHYVRPGSALWDEALRRGASYYLPGLVIPMLPRSLSEGLISLNPGVDRRALVLKMSLDGAGNCTATAIERALVRSRLKLGWSEVQDLYDGRPQRDFAPEILASLGALAVVGKRRMVLSDQRHVVQFRRAELAVAKDGARFVATRDLRYDVERYNEQISLLANSEGAKWLHDRRHLPSTHAVYRVHEPPPDQAITNLRDRIEGLVKTQRLAPSWRWEPTTETLAAYLHRLPDGGELGRVAKAIHRQAMLTGRGASFTAEPGVHHGVGAPLYARFTAPMREVVGIFLHEEAFESIAGRDKAHPKGTPDDQTLRELVIAAAQKAQALQRKLDQAVNRLVLDQIFGDALTKGTVLMGTVMGIDDGKVHVQLDDPPIDVKVYISHLARDSGPMLFQEDGNGIRWEKTGRPLALVGDQVGLKVTWRDAQKDRWALGLSRV